MTSGVKETKEIVQFVVALANFVANNAGKNPLGLVLAIGDLVGVLQLVPAAIGGAHLALAEVIDGLSIEEKEELYAEIERFKGPSATVEQVLEGALKAAVALSDLVGVLRGEKQA